ncbi:MAG: hypothetical protein NC432_02635 [Roseburia sp.]|nr:hypothetical protein [Roseburia sp.]MCM1097142.1 hypothetical protein [Ruminococcus flavefaciens]
MNRAELSSELVWAFQYVDDWFLDIAQEEAGIRKQRVLRKRVRPVAACILGLLLLLALPVIAIAANWFGLRDLLLPAKNFIGLSGFQESPEAQALGEWRAFLEEYDADGEIIGQIGNAFTGLEEKYGAYTVYTQEMADKLEEIAQKYQLKLHTEMLDIAPDELETYVGGKFLGKEIDISMGYPYLYENGTIHFEGDAFYWKSGEIGGRIGDRIGFQCRRTVKGTLDEVTLRIGNIDEYQELPYTAACGETVVLALSERKSLIFADFEQCFILLNVLGGSEEGITEEVLKEIADEIDFAMLKEVRATGMESQEGTGSAGQKAEAMGGLSGETDGTGQKSDAVEGLSGESDDAGQKSESVEGLSGESNGAGQEPGSEGSPENSDGTGSGGAGAQPAGGADGEPSGGAANDWDENALSEMRERYRAVLLENAEFVQIIHPEHRERDKKIRLENIREADEDGVTVETTQFAVVDLDGNGCDEIVLWLRANGISDYGVEILYDCGGEIYGFTLYSRQCMNLKTDGFFEASAGAGDTSICRLQLSEGGYAIEEVPGMGSGTFDQKADVTWYDLTEDNVEKQQKHLSH